MLLSLATMKLSPHLIPAYFPPWSQLTVERRLFLQFFVGILLCANNGACFCFALFSDQFRYSPFLYSQVEITAIATVGVLLSYFSLPTGFLYDKKGPATTITVGTFLNASGWLGLAYLFRSSDTTPRSVGSVTFFYGLSQLSASFFETSAMLTNLKTFSCYKGRVVLIQKTFMGMGTALAAQTYFIFFQSSSAMPFFFLFLFTYSIVVGVLSFYFIALPTDRTRCLGLNVLDDATILKGGGEPLLFRKPFNTGSIILVLNVGIVLLMSLIETSFEVSRMVRNIFALMTIGLPLSYVSMVFVSPNYTCNINGYKDSESDANLIKPEVDTCEGSINSDIFLELTLENVDDNPGSCSSPLVSNPGRREAVVSFLFRIVPPLQQPYLRNSKTLWENLRKRDIWLLWLSCFASWSAMTLVSSNSSQIYLSVTKGTFNNLLNAVYVSVFGVGGAVGRIGVGLLQPVLDRRNVPIAVFTFAAPFVNVIGLPLFLFIPKALLFLPYFLVGLSSGISWGSTILVVTSLFVERNCGKHYSFLYTAGMLSPVVFNTILFGPLYDYYGATQHQQGHSCEGILCIWAPIAVCFLLNLLVVPTSLYFVRRTVANFGL